MKISEETQALHDTIKKMDLIVIYRKFHRKTREYTYFSSAHGQLCRIDHSFGRKSNLGKFQKIEIISSIFSDHRVIRLEINYTKICVKYTNIYRKHIGLFNEEVITEEIKKYPETNDNGDTTNKKLWDAAKAVLRRKF